MRGGDMGTVSQRVREREEERGRERKQEDFIHAKGDAFTIGIDIIVKLHRCTMTFDISHRLNFFVHCFRLSHVRRE